MANENNNIKELVAEDDDPTSELETPTFSQYARGGTAEPRESDSNTHGLGEDKNAKSSSSQSIPELQSDLESRTRTIGKLQYDIEQLRAKWLGLEAEISAREDIVADLLQGADKLRSKIARKNNLLKKRNESIKNLKSELKQRDKDIESLRTELETQRTTEEEQVAARESTYRELQELRSKLEIVGTEKVSAEAEIRQRDEKQAALEQQLAHERAANAAHVAALEEAAKDLQYLRSELDLATREEHSLNTEINKRDELQSVLELENAELQRKLALQHDSNAETLAALEEARKDIDLLNDELETARNQSAAEIVQTQNITSAAVRELQTQRAKTEEYADSLRQRFEDVNASLMDVSKQRDRLEEEIAQLTQGNDRLSEELLAARESNAELQASMAQLRAEHEQELRTLRFELREAEDTLTQTNDLNNQLASDLVDSRGFKAELEQMLQTNEKEAQDRIAELEKQVEKLSGLVEDFEQKLETKNTAINVLLGELSKKTEQIDSIGEIDEVIQDIDSRMSVRIEEPNQQVTRQQNPVNVGGEKERITRVLVGSVGDQELRFPLFKNRLTIGRTAENDIQLKTAYISRRHAVVLTEGDSTRVIDWGSKNGVYVNSEKVKERILSNGDVLAVGNAKFRYEERPKRDA